MGSGRLKEGLYLLWGPYFTRWWFVGKKREDMGQGQQFTPPAQQFFLELRFTQGLFGYNGYIKNVYYRFLGAKIGRGVVIGEITALGEYDLLEVHD